MWHLGAKCCCNWCLNCNWSLGICYASIWCINYLWSSCVNSWGVYIHHWCCLNSLNGLISLNRLNLSLISLNSWHCGLNNGGCWLGNCCSCNCSTFNSLACSHFLFNSMLNSFLLSWILNFFFNSLLWDIVSLSLVANFWNIFNLMVNDLVFSYIFIYWNSNSFFKLIIFSYYLFIRNIFKSAFPSNNLTKFRSNGCSLKQNSLSYWLNIRLCTSNSSFYNNWLALNWRRASCTCDYLTISLDCCTYKLCSMNRRCNYWLLLNSTDNWLLYCVNGVDCLSWGAKNCCGW